MTTKKSTKKTPTKKPGGKRPKRMTLGGRKRHLSAVVDTMLSDAYPSEAMQLGQYLVDMGHMIVLSEMQSGPSMSPMIQDLSDLDRDIPPDKLN